MFNNYLGKVIEYFIVDFDDLLGNRNYLFEGLIEGHAVFIRILRHVKNLESLVDFIFVFERDEELESGKAIMKHFQKSVIIFN